MCVCVCVYVHPIQMDYLLFKLIRCCLTYADELCRLNGIVFVMLMFVNHNDTHMPACEFQSSIVCCANRG